MIYQIVASQFKTFERRRLGSLHFRDRFSSPNQCIPIITNFYKISCNQGDCTQVSSFCDNVKTWKIETDGALNLYLHSFSLLFVYGIKVVSFWRFKIPLNKHLLLLLHRKISNGKNHTTIKKPQKMFLYSIYHQEVNPQSNRRSTPEPVLSIDFRSPIHRFYAKNLDDIFLLAPRSYL